MMFPDFKMTRDPAEVTARELVIACVEEGRPAFISTYFTDDISSMPPNVYYTVSVVRHTIDRPLEVELDDMAEVAV